MKKQLEQVKQFNKAFNLPINETPTLGDFNECRKHHDLMAEEISEYWEAVNIGKHRSEKEGKLAILDALTDELYVLIGKIHYHGFGSVIEASFNEVHRSNMSKLDSNGEPIYRKDGKVLKSDLYSPPDLSKLI